MPRTRPDGPSGRFVPPGPAEAVGDAPYAKGPAGEHLGAHLRPVLVVCRSTCTEVVGDSQAASLLGQNGMKAGGSPWSASEPGTANYSRPHAVSVTNSNNRLGQSSSSMSISTSAPWKPGAPSTVMTSQLSVSVISYSGSRESQSR